MLAAELPIRLLRITSINSNIDFKKIERDTVIAVSLLFYNDVEYFAELIIFALLQTE